MRSFASYICLLGLFSFGFFFVESAEGHGNRMDEPVVVISESTTCRTPSTTVINQDVKGKYVVQQQFEGNPGVPRKRNEHWHYWSTSFTAYPGDEGYSSSCDTYREERECRTEYRRVRLGECPANTEGFDCEELWPPGTYGFSQQIGGINIYFDTVEEEICQDVRTLITP